MSCKEFLTDNKIFFEIFSTVGLGLMAIIISVLALRASNLQALVASAQVQPLFRIATNYKRDSEAVPYSEQTIDVSNDGFALREFDAEMKSVLKLTKRQGPDERTVLIPTVFTWISSATGSSTGLLWTFKQTKNWQSYMDLENGLRAQSTAQEPAFRSLELTNLVIVRYVDSINTRKTRMFLANGHPSGREVFEDEAAPILAAHKKKNARVENIENITLLSLLERLKTLPLKQ